MIALRYVKPGPPFWIFCSILNESLYLNCEYICLWVLHYITQVFIWLTLPRLNIVQFYHSSNFCKICINNHSHLTQVLLCLHCSPPSSIICKCQKLNISVSRSVGPMSFHWTKTVLYLRKYAMTVAQTTSTSAWNNISSIHTNFYFHILYSSVISCILYPCFIPAIPNHWKFVFRLQTGSVANATGPRR